MNVSIELANHGYFLAKPQSVGCTEEEAAAAAQGSVTIERQLTIRTNIEEALMTLARCEPQGKC